MALASSPRGRGRLPNIRLLPRACENIVAWAAQELQNNDRTQTDIYREFHERLEALKAEHRGELEFAIPSFQAFNRYSLKLAAFSNRIEQAREMSAAIAKRFDPEGEDDLTKIAAMAIKSLITELLVNSGESGISPQGAAQLSVALRNAAQAEGVSTARRAKVEKDFDEKARAAIDTVAKVKGLSAETVEDIKAQILGIPNG